MKVTYYLSFDIETDGPIPGIHSMLSLGAALFAVDHERGVYTIVDSFCNNLEQVKDGLRDPGTMDFWNKNPDAWKAATKDPKKIEVVIADFINWVSRYAQPHYVTPVAYPSGFDFPFLLWYLYRFWGENPFGRVPNCLDIKSYLAGKDNLVFKLVKKSAGKKYLKGIRFKHDHVAVNDALEQGAFFMNILEVKEVTEKEFSERERDNE